jgi:hypothetical protein
MTNALPDDELHWISTAEAAQILHVEQRFIQMLANDPDSGVRSRRVGRRWEVWRPDVEARAERLETDRQRPSVEMVPASMLATSLEAAHREVLMAREELVEARTQAELYGQQNEALRSQLIDAERRAAAAEARLTEMAERLDEARNERRWRWPWQR